jgi:DNA-binding winged helix-turn-helix (wHTH) protein/TolB-like protein/Tfp pilus assembly protein PilF
VSLVVIYRFEDCLLDISRRELRRDGTVCAIEPQVFELLHFLIANRERMVSRDEIFKTVWRGRIVSDSVLGNRINAARKAIGDDGAQQRLIRTLRRNGFRFVGEAFENPDRLATLNNCIIVQPGKLRVAVLPTMPVPFDEELFSVVKGIADALTIVLTRGRSFEVIAHERISTDGNNLDQVAHVFGAAYLLLCSARKAGNQVRLTVRLMDIWRDLHVWAQNYSCDLSTGFAGLDAVTANVAATVEPCIFAREASRGRRKPFEELNANDCVLMALSITRKRTRQNYALAEKLLERAIELDPYCVRAHSLAAYFHALQVLWGWNPRRETMLLAIGAAESAVALDEHDAWAHFALGWALTQNRSPEHGIEEYQKAIAINPCFSSAHACLGLALGYTGQIEKALAALDEGERLDAPEIFMGLTMSARAGVYAAAEKSDDTIKAARRSVQQGPGLVASQRHLVVNCALTGEMKEARAALKTFVGIVPNASLKSIAAALPYISDIHFNRTLDAFRLLGLT